MAKHVIEIWDCENPTKPDEVGFSIRTDCSFPATAADWLTNQLATTLGHIATFHPNEDNNASN